MPPRTVLELLPTALVPEGARLYPVGRLDQDSEGLLILTNDGDWAERVLHPRHGVEREYAIGLRGPLTTEQVQRPQGGHRARRRAGDDHGPSTDDRTRDVAAGGAPRPAARPTSSGIARSSPRVGSASCAGCSARSELRSSGWSGSGSGLSGSTTCGAAGRVAFARRRSAGWQVAAARAARGPRQRAVRRGPGRTRPPVRTGASGAAGSATAPGKRPGPAHQGHRR